MKKFFLYSTVLAVGIAACKKDDDTTPETEPIKFELAADSVNGRTVIALPDTTEEADVLVRFKNTDTKSIQVKWRREPLSVPSAWQLATCDNSICTDAKYATMTVNAQDSFDFKMVFRSKGVAGTGSAQVLFFDPTDSARTVKKVYFEAEAR